MKKVLIGTSGYNYKEWKNTFYPSGLPQRQWLTFYAKTFPTVEINNTFYTSVADHVYKNWYNLTPKDFAFAIKGNRYITHLKQLHNVENSVNLFFNACRNLDEKLHVILWQFPRNFIMNNVTFKRFETFLRILPKHYLYAFEFRSKSWFGEEVKSLLRKMNASLVISQSNVFPEEEIISGSFIYIRFHGPQKLYSSGYSEKELESWAKKITVWRTQYDVYCYFNNDAGGYATRDAKTLRSLIH